ncbi:ATP-dependent DNA helicase RecG [bacterium HR39]|nr:ATP-dependent DNA helicase RecG [bacterium HR39]
MGRTTGLSRAERVSGPALRDPLLFSWFAPVQTLPGVGRGLARRLARVLGEEEPRIRDLLFHIPRAVRELEVAEGPRPELVGRDVVVEVEISRHRPAHGSAPWRVEAESAGGRLDLVFFRARGRSPERRFPPGRRLFVHGRLRHFRGRFEIHHPEPVEGTPASGRLVLWPLTAEIGRRRFSRIVEAALAKVDPLPEWLAPEVLRTLRAPSFLEALARLHRGDDPPEGPSPARLRLALDELFALQLALALVRRSREGQPAPVLDPPGRLVDALLRRLPFSPTAAQMRAIGEIRRALARPVPMMRLLQGDVGSGKTLVALAAMLLAAEAGFQAVLMAPTDVLARQHARTMGTLLAPLGIEVGFLSGREPASARRRVLERLSDGRLSLCVGTHALFQPDVSFRRLGLVVVDEQHRFGVAQRLALVEKGTSPHLLLLTATPIPRTLVLCWYGDIATSRLDQRPPGRGRVDTRTVPATRLPEVVEAVGRALARGERGYWICPAVAPAEEVEIAAAEERFSELRERFGDVVGLAHGAMATAERQRTFEAFARGAVRLLVATTVVEVGVDVPEATFMVVEEAQRFGLSQLHQLRGRIGRGSRPGTCLFLYTPPLSAAAARRLRLLRACDDGFRIAEEDLLLRGPGEVLGVRQTGLPHFRFADPLADAELLSLAAEAARAALAGRDGSEDGLGRARRILLELFGHDGARALLRAG